MNNTKGLPTLLLAHSASVVLFPVWKLLQLDHRYKVFFIFVKFLISLLASWTNHEHCGYRLSTDTDYLLGTDF